MKKIIVLLLVLLFSANSYAHSIGNYLGASQCPCYDAYTTATRAENKSNTAIFIAIGAVALATFGVVFSLQQSEYHQGNVRIARF